MRRVVWSVLAGLGAFFIVLAIMSKLYVPGQAVKFPLNEYSVSTLVANNASWFSPKDASELSNVTLQVTSTVKGDVSAADTLGSSKYAVWQSFAATASPTSSPGARRSIWRGRSRSWPRNSASGACCSRAAAESMAAFSRRG